MKVGIFEVFDDAGFKLSLVWAFDRSGDFFDHSNFSKIKVRRPFLKDQGTHSPLLEIKIKAKLFEI